MNEARGNARREKFVIRLSLSSISPLVPPTTSFFPEHFQRYSLLRQCCHLRTNDPPTLGGNRCNSGKAISPETSGLESVRRNFKFLTDIVYHHHRLRIYIYMCVCVCVCVCISALSFHLYLFNPLSHDSSCNSVCHKEYYTSSHFTRFDRAKLATCWNRNVFRCIKPCIKYN